MPGQTSSCRSRAGQFAWGCSTGIGRMLPLHTQHLSPRSVTIDLPEQNAQGCSRKRDATLLPQIKGIQVTGFMSCTLILFTSVSKAAPFMPIIWRAALFSYSCSFLVAWVRNCSCRPVACKQLGCVTLSSTLVVLNWQPPIKEVIA